MRFEIDELWEPDPKLTIVPTNLDRRFIIRNRERLEVTMSIRLIHFGNQILDSIRHGETDGVRLGLFYPVNDRKGLYTIKAPTHASNDEYIGLRRMDIDTFQEVVIFHEPNKD